VSFVDLLILSTTAHEKNLKGYQDFKLNNFVFF